MYYLTRLLYTEKFALAIVILLSLGSIDIIFLQIRAVGEYPETELFSALIPLLAAWLALSSNSLVQRETLQTKRKRIILYGFLGLIIGLALWVDLLILPIVSTAGLLLLLFCYRELFSWAGLSLLLGVIIGAFPLILYNLTAPSNQNSLITLISIHQSGAKEIAAQHLAWLHHIVGTIMISLPSVTGANPDCPVTAFPLFGSPARSTLPCTLFHGAWGAGYLILWIIATSLTIHLVWQYRQHFFKQNDSFEDRQRLIYQCSRLMLLVSIGITLLLYVSSPTSVISPEITFRYLICALIPIPAVLWPLWKGLQLQKIPLSGKTKISFLLRGGLLLLIVATFISGTVRTFADIPAAQGAYQQESALVQDLLKIGASRIYSEYWTCNRLIFFSQEKLICGNTWIAGNKIIHNADRYKAYRAIVEASSNPAFVYPVGDVRVQTLEQELRMGKISYSREQVAGYVVYRPSKSVTVT